MLYVKLVMWNISFKNKQSKKKKKQQLISTLSLSLWFFSIYVTQVRHTIKNLICNLYVSNPTCPLCIRSTVLDPEKRCGCNSIALK